MIFIFRHFLILTMIASAPLLADTLFLHQPHFRLLNPLQVKSQFDGYVSQFGDYHFQPLSSVSVIKDPDTKGVLMGPESTVVHYQEFLLLGPIAVAIIHDQVKHQKVLIMRKTHRDLSPTLFISSEQHLDRRDYTHLPGLVVSKEWDSLMALFFEPQAIAKVSDYTFNVFRATHPSLAQQLHIKERTGFEYSLLASKMDHTPPTIQRHLVDSLIQLQAHDQGRDLLDRMGVDAFRLLTPQERRGLFP